MTEIMQGLRQQTVEQDEKSQADIDEQDVCDECGGRLVPGETESEKHCEDCGLVIETEQIDRGPEWRAYNSREQQKKSRVGAPRTQLIDDKGMSTQISWKDQDGYGRALSSGQRDRMRRLRKWNKRIRSSATGQELQFGIAEIRRMGSALGVPKQPKETAAVLFRQARSQDVLKGRSVEGVASGSLYIALRKHNAPRSLDEIEMVSRADRTKIMRAQREISRELGIETTITNPMDYLPRFATKLQVPREIEREAKELVKDAEGTQLLVSGNRPDALAAAALYAASIVCDHMLTQKEIRDEIGITTVTIRNHYRHFLVESDRVPVTEDDLDEHGNPDDLLDLILERTEDA